MKKKAALFQLIKSMNRGEKRAFQLYASKYAKDGENNYVKLFNAVNKQTTYDEKALKKKFINEAFVKQFSVIKNQLFNLLIDCLRAYHTKYHVEFKINKYIESAKILNARGLYEQAAQAIKKARTLAEHYDLIELLFYILSVERKVMRNLLVTKEYNIYLTKRRENTEQTLLKLENKEAIQVLSQKISVQLSTYGEPRNKEALKFYEDILSSEILRDENKALTIHARFLMYSIYAIYNQITGNDPVSVQYWLKIKENMEAKPDIIAADTSAYIGLLNNLLLVMLRTQRYDSFYVLLSELKAIPKKFPNISYFIKQRIFEISSTIEIDSHLHRNTIAEGLAILPTIQKKLSSYVSIGRFVDREIRIYFGIALLYFLSERFVKAQIWFDKVLKFDKQDVAIHLMCYAKVFSAIVCYEKRDYHFLLHHIETAKRYLHKHKRYFNVEKQLMRMLYELSKAKGVADKEQSIFLKYQIAFREQTNEKGSNVLWHNLKLWAYIESKLNKRKMQYLLLYSSNTRD